MAHQTGVATATMHPFARYGSREYMARDLEGHPWSFGTYVPGSEG